MEKRGFLRRAIVETTRMLLPSFVRQPPVCLALLVLLVGATASGEISFAPDGEIAIPAGDCEVSEGKLVARFEAARWGMYSLSIDGGGTPLKATVNGEAPARAAGESEGDYYIARNGPCVVEVTGATKGVRSLKLTPAWEGEAVVQEDGAAIELDAKDCRIEGVMLRYEPNPKKLCIGYWGNPKDTPHWEFTVTTPGTYEVLLTQGCGKGGGGSEAVLETGGAALAFTVEDTGGYQNWVERSLGTVTFEKAGVQGLKVRVVKKARGIMDIRRIVLKPAKKQR
jgi:hypothetical protein